MQSRDLLLRLMQYQVHGRNRKPLHLSVRLELLPLATRWLLQHPDTCGPLLAAAAAADTLQEIELPMKVAAICGGFAARTHNTLGRGKRLTASDELLVQYVGTALLPLLANFQPLAVQCGL
jgi:hypothetical protein